jgi:putative flavoprotein involved in K+ transport
LSERIDTVVVGGGQAGLVVSHELARAGVDHVVLERGRIGETWRGRWDSFCLVTPNWTVQLPSHPYDGEDPNGFMLRDEIVAYLERYSAAVEAPVREGVAVTSLQSVTDGGFHLETSAGPLAAKIVILATGGYQRPHRPAGSATLAADLLQIDIEDYHSPGDLPSGPVLVVGSGQSGCQIAEELHKAGRDVFLACGKAPWAPRRLGDHDIVWWALETGFINQPVGALPSPAARLGANVLTTGQGGGRDLHLRTLQRMGVTLLGHFLGAEARRARFAPDLMESVAWGDARYGDLMNLVRKTVAERGLPQPDIPEPEPFTAETVEEVNLDGFGAVLFAGGFRPSFDTWVRCPGVVDEFGFPIQEDGASTVVHGLYFAGVHFMRTRKSATFVGIGEDAAIVAGSIAATREQSAGV